MKFIMTPEEKRIILLSLQRYYQDIDKYMDDCLKDIEYEEDYNTYKKEQDLLEKIILELFWS